MRDFKTIIEFGTSKISCAVAGNKQRLGLEVLGCAQIGYSGIKKTSWVDADEVYYAIEQVVESVERQTGTRIRSAEVGVPGSFLKIVNKNAQIEVAGRVEEQHIEAMMRRARHFDINRDLALLQEYPAWFLLDDGNIYLDPVDVPTKRLRGCMSFVLANKFFLDDVARLLKHLGIRVEQFIPEPVAEALYLVPMEKRDSLAILVDMGYYSTDVSLIYGDAILHFTTIQMGGGNITSDIAYAMKTNKETAEQLKRRYSFGLEENNNSSYLYAKDEEGKLKKFPYDLVKEAIDARVEHLILYIDALVQKVEASVGRKLDVFLTGGGIAFMRGAGSFYRSVTGRMPVMVKVPSTKLQTPDLHATYALLKYACDEYEGNTYKPQETQKKGLFRRS